ncbi:MAG: hypothetical protein ABI333_20570 [bacterium]
MTSLLESRKDDPAFWGPLKGLLRQTVRSAEAAAETDRLVCPDAELLRGAELGVVIAEIRGALPHAAPNSRAWIQRLSAPALCFVLLLGMAAGGCAKVERTAPTGAITPPGIRATASMRVTAERDRRVVGSQNTATARAYVGTGNCEQPRPPAADAADRPKTVAGYVKGSDLGARTKRKLISCLRRFRSSRRADLVEVFRRSSPEEIATHLEELAASVACRPREEVIEAVRGVALYKGVSFPEYRS